MLLAAASAFALSLCFSALLCQNVAQAGNNPTGIKRIPGKSYEDTGRFVVLSSPMELPEVPKYTGRATFVSGLQYPDNPHGPVVLLVYRVHEDAAEVLQWYSDALKSYLWQVQDLKPETRQVLASKGRTECTILASQYNGPGFRTEITITYKVGK
jgi:hypothetical protein